MSIPSGEVQFNRGSIAYNLPYTCTILRREQTGETPYDEPIYGDYEPLDTDVACRFWVVSAQGAGGAEESGDRRMVLMYEYRLKVTPDTDIDEDDTVDDVVNQMGETMNQARLRVTAIWRRTHETVCVLEVVR